MPSTTSSEQSSPFIRELASSDRQTREKALNSLRTYLHRSTPFTELDFLKLWKGLFFCMWMSDKTLNQQRLARDLADLCDVLSGRENLLGFVRAFWKTIAREWGGIDALRMDKFLYLVRCYVGKGFACVGTREWADEELLEEYLGILEAVPLNVAFAKIPNGLRYHVIDVYVDELDKVDVSRTAPVEKILVPLRELGEKSSAKAVRLRVRGALEDERLRDWKAAHLDDPEGDGEMDVSEDEEVSDETRQLQMKDGGDDDDDEFSGFED